MNYDLPTQLKSFMKKFDLTINALADKSGISEDTIKALRTGRIKSPGIDILLKLAEVFECSIDELIGRDFSNPDEKKLLCRYRSLPSHSQNVVLSVIRLERAAQNSWSQEGNTFRIPCIIPNRADGDGFNYDESHIELLEIPNPQNTEITFAYCVKGHHLSPYYYPNDILLFNHHFPCHSEIGLFTYESFTYLRMFYELPDGTLELRPLTQTGNVFSMRFMEHFQCMGTFVGLLRQQNLRLSTILSPNN